MADTPNEKDDKFTPYLARRVEEVERMMAQQTSASNDISNQMTHMDKTLTDMTKAVNTLNRVVSKLGENKQNKWHWRAILSLVVPIIATILFNTGVLIYNTGIQTQQMDDVKERLKVAASDRYSGSLASRDWQTADLRFIRNEKDIDDMHIKDAQQDLRLRVLEQKHGEENKK